MKKIMLNIHPATTIADIDLEAIRERMAQVQDWNPELHDARVSDASFVNVILQLPSINAGVLRRLREVFGDMPNMRTRVWKDFRSEAPLETLNIGVLKAAAEAFGKAQAGTTQKQKPE